MAKLFDGLFSGGGTLGGVTRGGKREGRWRPGHRSVELAIEDHLAQARARDPNAGPRGPVGQPGRVQPGAQILAPRAPSGVGPRSSILTPGMPGPRAPVPGLVARPGPRAAPVVLAPRARGPAAPPPGRVNPTRGGFLSGLFSDGRLGDAAADGTPDAMYVPNGEIWVSNQPVALYWRTWRDWRAEAWWRFSWYQPLPYDSTNQPYRFEDIITPYQVPVLYPDGTPVVGHVWMPKIDLTRDMGAAYFVDGKRTVSQRQLSQGGSNQNIASLDFYPHYQDPNATAAFAELWTFYNLLAQNKSLQWESRIDFDWQNVNPSTQAYPFVYDELTADYLFWSKQPADLYRSDGGPIVGDFPHALAPMPLRCLEFIDALATGAHGLEGCVEKYLDGTFAIIPDALEHVTHDVPFWNLSSSATQAALAQLGPREPNLQWHGPSPPPAPPAIYTDYAKAYGAMPFLCTTAQDVAGPHFGRLPEPVPVVPTASSPTAPVAVGPNGPFDPNDESTWYGPDDPEFPNWFTSGGGGAAPAPATAPAPSQERPQYVQSGYQPQEQLYTDYTSTTTGYEQPTSGYVQTGGGFQQQQEPDVFLDETTGVWWSYDANGAYLWWDEQSGTWWPYDATAATALAAPSAAGPVAAVGIVGALAALAAGLI